MGPRLGRVPGRFPARILLLCVSLLHERVAAVSYILAYRLTPYVEKRAVGSAIASPEMDWVERFRTADIVLPLRLARRYPRREKPSNTDNANQ